MQGFAIAMSMKLIWDVPEPAITSMTASMTNMRLKYVKTLSFIICFTVRVEGSTLTLFCPFLRRSCTSAVVSP